MSFAFVDPISNLGFPNGICKHLLNLSQIFEEIAQTVAQRIESCFGDITFFLEDITLLCLEIAKLEQLECRRLFAGVFANTYWSILGLGDVRDVVVKITIYVIFVQKLLWYLIVKWRVCINWKIAFWETSTTFGQ